MLLLLMQVFDCWIDCSKGLGSKLETHWDYAYDFNIFVFTVPGAELVELMNE